MFLNKKTEKGGIYSIESIDKGGDNDLAHM